MVDISVTNDESTAASGLGLSHSPWQTGRPSLTAAGSLLARATISLLVVAGDAIAFLAAYLVMLPFDIGLDKATTTRILVFAVAATMVLYASARLYPGYRLYAYEQIRRRATASFKVAALAASGVVLLSAQWQLAAFVAGFLGASLLLQPFTNHIARRIGRQLGLWGEPAVILAGPDRSRQLVEHFDRHWKYGIRPELPYSNGQRPIRTGSRRIVLLAGDASPSAEQLADLRREFAEVILLADTPSLKLSGLQPADNDGQIGMRLALAERSSTSNIIRRALDLAVAIPAALVFAPIIAVAGAAIYAIDPGSVFYWQLREGLGGRPVRVLKLRTMYRDAEERLEALFQEHPEMKAEWVKHFKLRRDPRILPVVGQFLRSTSCDELPQLFNVIMGDMGLVGPRPFPEYHLKAMDSEFRNKRRSVTPGITGLWQVSARSTADVSQQTQLDSFYIDNRSLWLDWHILISTIPAVFKRGGAY